MLNSPALIEAAGLRVFVDQDLLSADILAVFTSRIGGTSRQPYDSLNLAFHVDDNNHSVIENRALVAAALSIDATRLTFADQIHGTTVGRISEHEAGAGADEPSSAVAGTDVLLSSEIGVYLVILTADCLPIILVDPEQKVASVVHAGWRGSFERVAAGAVQAMMDSGAGVKSIQAILGPHIRGDCYEIGVDLYDRFAERFNLRAVEHNHRLDLAALNRATLVEAGVQAENIKAISLCTHCRSDLFYSWRRDGITGRQAAIAGILPSRTVS